MNDILKRYTGGWLPLVLLVSCGCSMLNARNVFTDDNVVVQFDENVQQSPSASTFGNGTKIVDSTVVDADMAETEAIQNSIAQSLDEHFKKVRQTFGLLDLRPKEGCSRSRRDIHMFYCPTPNPRNYKEWSCIRIDELCNGLPDCPGAEDEDPTLCMYWLAGQEQLRILKKIIVARYQMDADSNPASRPFTYEN